MIAIHSAALLVAFVAIPLGAHPPAARPSQAAAAPEILLVAGPGDGLRGDRGERRSSGPRPAQATRPTSYIAWPNVTLPSAQSLQGVRDASERFEARLARCEQVERVLVQDCVADSLQAYASDLEEEDVVLATPAPEPPAAVPAQRTATRSIPIIIRQTARRVRAAPSAGQASADVGAAVDTVRQPIQLVRATDDFLASIEREARTIIANALETAQATLQRASGL